ncbi:Uncharacterised protein [Achromobacter sp. 2789STDY5608615]|nr:Uncharacterised protein [Achromobacter sp. 2789STDY5608615]
MRGGLMPVRGGMAGGCGGYPVCASYVCERGELWLWEEVLRRSPLGQAASRAGAHDCGPEPSLRTAPSSTLLPPAAAAFGFRRAHRGCPPGRPPARGATSLSVCRAAGPVCREWNFQGCQSWPRGRPRLASRRLRGWRMRCAPVIDAYPSSATCWEIERGWPFHRCGERKVTRVSRHAVSPPFSTRWRARVVVRVAGRRGGSSVRVLRSLPLAAGCASLPGRGRRRSDRGSSLPGCRRGGWS